jgi:hypothetical protein
MCAHVPVCEYICTCVCVCACKEFNYFQLCLNIIIIITGISVIIGSHLIFVIFNFVAN